jgi:hypothetical protein
MAAQLPDFIVVNKEKMHLYTNPLEQYWTFLKKRKPSFITSQGCKRGYIATWEIHNKQLYLRGISGVVKRNFLFFPLKPKKYTMKLLFPKHHNVAVKAKWFSGKLRIPRGSRTIFSDQDYDSRFEQDIIITIDHGNVVKTVTLDNKQQALIVN